MEEGVQSVPGKKWANDAPKDLRKKSELEYTNVEKVKINTQWNRPGEFFNLGEVYVSGGGRKRYGKGNQSTLNKQTGLAWGKHQRGVHNN